MAEIVERTGSRRDILVSLHEPVTPADLPPESVVRSPATRRPILGIALGLFALLGVGVWTALRIHSVTGEREVRANQRAEDAKRVAARADGPKPVRVQSPQRVTWQPVVELEGTLTPARSAELGFKHGGRLGALRARLGDTVKEGAVLATLESAEAQAELRAANAQVNAARAEHTLASDSDERTRSLVQSNSLPEVRGVESAQQRALAQARLDAAQAKQSLHLLTLSNHVLKAPFAGTITRAPEGEGAVVGPGAALYSIADVSTLRLKSTVIENDANLLVPGAPVEVSLEHGTVRGKIAVVLRVVDPKTRRVPVEAVFENHGSIALRAGSFVRARTLAGDPVPVMRVSRDALRPGFPDEVLVERAGILERRAIVYSVADDGALLVRRGIEEGEHVVIGATPELKAGDRVTGAPLSAEKPAFER